MNKINSCTLTFWGLARASPNLHTDHPQKWRKRLGCTTDEIGGSEVRVCRWPRQRTWHWANLVCCTKQEVLHLGVRLLAGLFGARGQLRWFSHDHCCPQQKWFPRCCCNSASTRLEFCPDLQRPKLWSLSWWDFLVQKVLTYLMFLYFTVSTLNPMVGMVVTISPSLSL